jgi:hypothetical protein
VFKHFLGLGFFNSPKGFLVHKQASPPIVFGGIGFIPTTAIALTDYLGSWAFVASIIVVRFMVNQRPFPHKALTRVNNNTFYFQQHFKVTCDLLPPLPRAIFLPFNNSLGNT